MISEQHTKFERQVIAELDQIKEMLFSKNRKYGNSALEPIRVFSKASTTEQLLVRMDDKLSRIKAQNPGDDEDPAKDLIGYLILFMIANNNAE